MGAGALTHNPNFVNLELEENAEIRFFCEAFSLVDAVNNSNLLWAFSTQVNESKDGRIKWEEISGLFPKGTKSASYTSSIARTGEIIDQVVRKGWITPMRTKSLSTLASEAHRYHKNDSKALLESAETEGIQNIAKSSSKGGPNRVVTQAGSKTVSEAWKEISHKLKELAQFQDKNMNYHTDFQKENYLPHPDSWKVYTGTFAFIFVTLLYAILC